MGQAGRDRQSEAQPESLKSKAASAIIILVSLAAFNPSVSIRDWTGEFSTAKQTAAFVAESIRPGEPVLLPYAHQNYSLIFFAPSLGYKSLETGEDIRFFSWSREKEMSGYGDIHSCIKARFAESGRFAENAAVEPAGIIARLRAFREHGVTARAAGRQGRGEQF